MSENIKVSEVSDILRKQLEGINTHVQLDEIGTVLQVSDGVVRIYGLRNAEANELLEFDNGIKAIVMNLEEDNVGAVLLGPTDRIKEGFIVKRTKHIASIRVGEGMLGRVIDPLGEPLDGKGLVMVKLWFFFINCLGKESAGSNLPSACQPAVADRTESCGCHDSYWAWTT